MVDDSSLVRGDRSSGSPASGPGRAENEGGSDAVTQARGAAILTPARILLIVGGLAVLAAAAPRELPPEACARAARSSSISSP